MITKERFGTLNDKLWELINLLGTKELSPGNLNIRNNN